MKSTGTFLSLNRADIGHSDTIFIYSKDKVISGESSGCCSVYYLKEAMLRMAKHNKMHKPMRQDKIVDISRKSKYC